MANRIVRDKELRGFHERQNNASFIDRYSARFVFEATSMTSVTGEL